MCCSEVSLARRQNLKLAWEDAWNHEKMEFHVFMDFMCCCGYQEAL